MVTGAATGRQAPCALKVKVKCWNGLVPWLWEANHENCSIFHTAFSGSCLDMRSDDCLLLQAGAPPASAGIASSRSSKPRGYSRALRAQSGKRTECGQCCPQPLLALKRPQPRGRPGWPGVRWPAPSGL
ncbi:unnamed protein product [Rangifer tarandus platyrhynchus]|uniref:Uncharacterized protein n=2 Tax=Rangifer tarandus platyrhynchus TaxID=3082113 RepID=A0ABN8Z2U1_RANTA|nr:unnamed protein product [Rangifer tarandus platyrhynchus]CAI9703145.1 unnamed protein product [Rangifer tarandus platyrhynchus]